VRKGQLDSRDNGFSLVEVLVAALILVTLAVASATALSAGVASLSRSRDETVALSAARRRLEELRSLEWGNGDAAAPVAASDQTTDLSGPAPAPGGPGLGDGPASALVVSQPRYVDHLDRAGTWLSSTVAPPVGARFTRRWAVAAAAGAPDVRMIQVRVTRLVNRAAGEEELVWLFALKARKAS
jgi:prepilin-type N-terminal cleavage/methylation domain-containing protein